MCRAGSIFLRFMNKSASRVYMRGWCTYDVKHAKFVRFVAGGEPLPFGGRLFIMGCRWVFSVHGKTHTLDVWNDKL